MKINRFVKSLCLVIALILMFGTSFSASAVDIEFKNTDISDGVDNINVEEEKSSIEDVEDNKEEENTTSPETTVVTEHMYDPEVDTAIDSGELSCESEYEIYDRGITTSDEEKEPFDETYVIFDTNSISSTDNKFTEMFDVSYFAKQGESYDTTKEEYFYYVMQGSCTDGEFDYFGYIVKKRRKIKGKENEYEKVQLDSGVLCVKKGNDGKYTKIANTRFPSLDTKENEINHVNDLTYNSKLKKIVVACCEKGIYNKLYLISPSQLQTTEELSNLDSVLVSCMVASIDYNETHNSYVVGLSNAINRFAILDNKFDVVKIVGHNALTTDADTYVDGKPQREWVRQSCCADDSRIYSMCYYDDKNNSLSYTTENKIRVFDWNGEYIKTININVTNGIDKIYEGENIFIKDDKLQVGFNCLRSRTITYCSLNLAEKMFHIQYCPDENVDEYANDFDNGNASSLVIRGVETPLLKQRISITGKVFTGWTAYRADKNKWLYKSSDGKTNAWYIAGEQPAGYTKYVYIDEQKVSNTGKEGEHVLMCAQWADTDKFYISFYSSGMKGIPPKQEVVYGESTPLIANTFTKTNREFQGWNAYWVEKNMWYYISADKETKKWFREGEQDEGYTKYLYDDEQSVSGTAYAGGHIQMHALWNEFYVQFDANGAIIKNENILVQNSFHYKKGNTNVIPFFASSTLNGKTVNITGYHLYRKEINMWYYISADGKTKKWCKEGKQPAGYTLYVKSKPATGNNYLGITAYPGEHLLLRAIWS